MKTDVECPLCQTKIHLQGSLSLNQRIPCPDCDDVLKVACTKPLRLEWAWEDLLEGPEISVRRMRPGPY